MMKYLLKLSLLCVSFVLGVSVTLTVTATPKEVIIVRHGDKTIGVNKSRQYSGRYLSAKGVLRSMKFAIYYQTHFAKPDFIFAAKPAFSRKVSNATSMRPMQTMMPLANLLTAAGEGNVIIHTPFSHLAYAKLAHILLQEKKYQGKRILICWQHGDIDALAKDLGVKQVLPRWHGHNYDQVYVLKYTMAGHLTAFRILKNQYPIHGNPTWASLAAR